MGGEGTHGVISGHRGLPSALLFTDFDQLEVGDKFALHVLGETLVYEVDQILVVEPTDVSSLVSEQGQDYVTLVTRTPYGVNTQRPPRTAPSNWRKILRISGEEWSCRPCT